MAYQQMMLIPIDLEMRQSYSIRSQTISVYYKVPRAPDMANDPKIQAIELLKRHHEISRLQGPSIFSVNSRAVAYIRFSKRHKNGYYFGVGEKEFNAIKDKNSFILVVSVGFAPALVQDAESEQAGLVSVDELLKLLSIHREMPSCPSDYADLFSKVGLIRETDLERFTDEIKICRRWIKDALFLADALDLEFRSLEEIKGRVDVQAQQLKVAPLNKERIKAALHSMATEPLRLVSVRDGSYALRFYPQQLRERIQAFLRLAFSEP